MTEARFLQPIMQVVPGSPGYAAGQQHCKTVLHFTPHCTAAAARYHFPLLPLPAQKGLKCGALCQKELI